MHTLFDFITYIKGVEYIVAISAIGLYMLYWEILKPKPFKSVVETGRDDMRHIRRMGYANAMKTIGKVMAAPFIGLAYIVALPIGFAYALGSAAINGILGLAGKEASFGWRPSEAYLSGKKKEKKEGEEKKENEVE
ncbi:MAG: hypothetical protein QMD44_05720 [Thermodesulfovibrionales bacterium]|jgi:hypothetical protein|nr:hypothetical protein [Thermodesulfovibrionales bacterium]